MMVLKSNLTGMKSRLMENTHNLHYRDKKNVLACKTIVKTCSFIVLLTNIIVEVGCAQVKVNIVICNKKKFLFDADVYGFNLF